MVVNSEEERTSEGSGVRVRCGLVKRNGEVGGDGMDENDFLGAYVWVELAFQP